MSERGAHVDDLVLDYVYDELDASTRARVEAHLEGCEACRESVEALAGTRRVMSSLPEAAPSRGPEAILQAAAREARLRGEKRRGLLSRLGAFVAGHPFTTTVAVAAVAMILVVGVDFGRESTMLTGATPAPEARKAAEVANAQAAAAPKEIRQAKPELTTEAPAPAKAKKLADATATLQAKAAPADKGFAQHRTAAEGRLADELAAGEQKAQPAARPLAKKKDAERFARHAKARAATRAPVAPTRATRHHRSQAPRMQPSLDARGASDLDRALAPSGSGEGAVADAGSARAAPPPPPPASRLKAEMTTSDDQALLGGGAKPVPDHEAAKRRARARAEARTATPAAAGPAATAAPRSPPPAARPTPPPSAASTPPATGGLGATTEGAPAAAPPRAPARHAARAPPSSLAKARRLADAGHCDRATPILDTLLARPSAPWQAEAYLYRCGCRAKAGQADGARSDCAMVVALAPGSLYAQKARALLRSLDAFRNRAAPADADVPIK